MSKLSPEQIDEIVSSELPNYEVKRESEGNRGSLDEVDFASATMDQVEAVTPDLEALKAKYLNQGASSPDYDAAVAESVELEAAEAPEEESPEDVIVAVVPKSSLHPWDRGARPKAVVISGSTKKIVGQQG